jgi:hypothetical protein
MIAFRRPAQFHRKVSRGRAARPKDPSIRCVSPQLGGLGRSVCPELYWPADIGKELEGSDGLRLPRCSGRGA